MYRPIVQFRDFYGNENLPSDLSDDVATNLTDRLHSRYHLDELLSAMLKHVPDLRGQRYVTVTLHIANGKGEDPAVANVATTYLFLPGQFL